MSELGKSVVLAALWMVPGAMFLSGIPDFHALALPATLCILRAGMLVQRAVSAPEIDQILNESH